MFARLLANIPRNDGGGGLFCLRRNSELLQGRRKKREGGKELDYFVLAVCVLARTGGWIALPLPRASLQGWGR